MSASFTVDALSAFFLICFGIGLLTSLGALLLGARGHGDAGGHAGDFSPGAHGGGLSHAGFHSGDLAHPGLSGTGGVSGSTSAGGMPHSAAAPAGGVSSHSAGPVGQGTHGSPVQAEGAQQVSVFNLNTFLGFLLGFGAAGFAVKQALAGIPLLLNLLVAALGGLVFAYIIYWVLAKILIKGQSEYLRVSDFNLIGMEGIISSTIFADHLGEVSYVLNRSHAAMPAQERDGREVKKGEAVIIIEVNQGVAMVLPKDEFMRHAQTKKEE